MHGFLKISLYLLAVLTILGFELTRIQAAEHRHHKAHEHGVAQMNVVLEGNDLYVEFNSPAASIVGFEHQPNTKEQKAAVDQAVETLKKGATLFVLSSGAEGSFVKSTVDTDIEGESDGESEHSHGRGEDESAGEVKKDKQRHRKEHHAEHEHEHERHSDFSAQYHIVCKQPQKLVQMAVLLFDLFPGIEHIKVQLVNGARQTALELTAEENKISF